MPPVPRAGRTAGPLVATLILLLVLPASAALAAAEVTTPWPVIEVEPGAEVTITLQVAADPGERVDLDVVEVPDGWETRLRGGGFVVRAVTPGADEPAEVDLEVSVPTDASEGTHRVGVVGRGEDGRTDRLDLDLVVAEEVAGAVEITTEFPELAGAADSTFRWSLELDNALPGETTFSLQAIGPDGWDVSARPSTEDQATTLTLPGGETATIDVEATPPERVEAGRYELTVVVNGGGQRTEVPLTASVEGVVELELTTVGERLNAEGTTGEVTRVPLLLTNTGSHPLADLVLSADPPADWEVTFEPEELAPIPPGETAEVTALVTPADDAIAGDYAVGLEAEAAGRTSAVEVRFQVGTPLGWGAVGAGLIALALGGLGWTFRRFGRR